MAQVFQPWLKIVFLVKDVGVNDQKTTTWPLKLALDDEAYPEIEVFGKPLILKLRPGPALELNRGTEESTRLAALPETYNNLVFLPSFGDRPLLVFPRPQLLCPADLTLEVNLAIPLFLRLCVETEDKEHLLLQWTPPSTSLGAYGPVDQATICTSCRCPVIPLAYALSGAEPAVLASLLQWTSPGVESRQLPLWAHLPLTIRNQTTEPLEVSKVMVPTSSLTLFQSTDPGKPGLFTNELTLKLMGTQEAELISENKPREKGDYKVVAGRAPLPTERRPHLFLYNYKAKTGLEHGF